MGEYGKFKTSMVSFPTKTGKLVIGFTYRSTNSGSCRDRRNSHLCILRVTKIVDYTNPYPALLWIDWTIDKQIIINFKKRILTFEDEEQTVVAPLDPLECQRYVKKVHSEGKGRYLDHIYNITFAMDDYVNPMTDVNISWKSVSFLTLDSREALKN